MWRISALDPEGRVVGSVERETGLVTIGRDPDRLLIIPSEQVSRRHAVMVLAGSQPSIADEGSLHGVRVDGARIHASTIVGPASRIEIAGYRIVLELLVASDAAAGGSERAEAIAPLRLVAVGGPYRGSTLEIAGSEVSIGRAPENDIVFEDPSLSRQHARLKRLGGARVQVVDLSSANGTFVNGRKIRQEIATTGDTLRFGDLKFRLSNGAPSAPLDSNVVRMRASAWLLVVLGLVGASVGALAVGLARSRPGPVAEHSAEEGITRVVRQARLHLETARKLFASRRYDETRRELKSALELDPANLDARRLDQMAARAPEEQRALRSALAQLELGDRRGLEGALELAATMSPGRSMRMELEARLGPALERFGLEHCGERDFLGCAWALCRAFELASADWRPDARAAQALKDVERRLGAGRGYVACRAAP